MSKPRTIPEPIINALRRQFPRLLTGEIEGDDVYLLMVDAKGTPRQAIHYIAGADFMTAMRVCDSGIDNFVTLCGEEGFHLTLLSPRD